MISKKFRVKDKERFAFVIKKKKFITCKSFTLHYVPNDLEYIRVGITVSKKLGKAHERNKIKRQVRHIVYECINFEKKAYDIVIIVREGFLALEFAQNQQQFQKLYDEFIKKTGGTL